MLENIPGVKKARAFGSRTKGSATPGSDLDIIVYGDVKYTNPQTIHAVREVQRYAEEIGIGKSGGRRPLDIHPFENHKEMVTEWKKSPTYDSAKGVPKPVKIE